MSAHRTAQRTRLFRIFFAGSALLAAGCGVENALVGGRCREGYSPNAEGTRCVPEPGLMDGTSPALPYDLPPGDDSFFGWGLGPMAELPGDGDSSGADSSDPDSSDPDSSDPDANDPDASDAGADADDDAGADASTDANEDVTEDAAPDAADAAVDAPEDAPVDAPPDAPPECVPPMVECHGGCELLAPDDANNCGACGKTCNSNICAGGECQGATPGDVVLVGHDYDGVKHGSVQAKVLVNAVSIPTSDPIRVLVYEGSAPADTRSAVRTLLVAGIRRQLRFTSGDDAALESATLAQSYDVVLVHDSAGADPALLGGRWASSLATFTSKGGVLVAIDGASGGMPELVKSAGLFNLSSHVLLPAGTHFAVSAPGDVVGTQLLSPYASTGASAGFVGMDAEDADLRWIVREKTDAGVGLPIVVHKVVR